MATRIWIGTDVGNVGDLGTAANWSGAALPGAGDTAVFQDSSQNADLGLADLSGNTLAALIIDQTYTGYLGSLTAYAEIEASKVFIGQHHGYGAPIGSGRIKLNAGAVQSDIQVDGSAAASADTAIPPIRLLCNHASTIVRVHKGKVALAAEAAGETSTLDQLILGYLASKAADADVVTGDGLTLATVLKMGGALVLASAATTVKNYAGRIQTVGAGAIGTLQNEGGEMYPESSGVVTKLNAYGGTIDLTRSTVARTITDADIRPGVTLKWHPDLVAWTNPRNILSPVSAIFAAA